MPLPHVSVPGPHTAHFTLHCVSQSLIISRRSTCTQRNGVYVPLEPRNVVRSGIVIVYLRRAYFENRSVGELVTMHRSEEAVRRLEKCQVRTGFCSL